MAWPGNIALTRLCSPCAAAFHFRKLMVAMQVLDSMELTSVALGLLINLASSADQYTVQLLQQHKQPSRHKKQPAKAAAAAGPSPPDLLHLLCAVMSATTSALSADSDTPTKTGLGQTPLGQQPEDHHHQQQQFFSPPTGPLGRTLRRTSAAAAGGGGGGVTPGGVYVTERCLLADKDRGEASIVEVYSGMLLGFMVQASSQAREAASGLLPGGNLGVVVGAVERCLQFYVQTGAITDSSRAKLEGLLKNLQQYMVEAGGGQDVMEEG